MGTLRIRLFGQLRTYRDDRRIHELPPRKEQHLLCYLALHRQHCHSRSVLAGLLWADRPEEQARKSLRTSLWRLRKFLDQGANPAEAYLLTENDSVCFNPRSDYWLDVEEFENSVAKKGALDTAGARGRELIDHLTRAVELYQGDLLEGCYEDWCIVERERLRQVFLDLLSTLMGYHRSQGAYEAAIRFGRQIVVQDPLLEGVHRELMELYCLTGNRGAALRQYRLCKDLLDKELGVEPAEDLQTLYAQLCRHQDAKEPGRGTHNAGLPAHAPKPQAHPVRLPEAWSSLAFQMDDILSHLQELQGEFTRSLVSLEETRRQLGRLEVDLVLQHASEEPGKRQPTGKVHADPVERQEIASETCP